MKMPKIHGKIRKITGNFMPPTSRDHNAGELISPPVYILRGIIDTSVKDLNYDDNRIVAILENYPSEKGFKINVEPGIYTILIANKELWNPLAIEIKDIQFYDYIEVGKYDVEYNITDSSEAYF